MRNPGQILPDHAAILATLSRSAPTGAGHVVPGTVARVTGEARPGPDGLLTAPISGRPCVWWRTVTVRHGRTVPVAVNAQQTFLAPQPLTPALASDMGYLQGGGDSAESPAPFVVADGSGEVLLDPAWADIDTAVVSVNDVVGDGYAQPWTVRREWILPPGAPVFACGAVAYGPGRPMLRASERDSLVASTRGEALVVQRAQSVLAATPAAGNARQLQLIVTLVGGLIGIVVVYALLAALR